MSSAANATLALCRAFYGKRLTAEKYDALSSCSSLSELVSLLRGEDLYSVAFSKVQPSAPAIEEAAGSSAFTRFEKICRFERAIGDEFYRYFIVRSEIDEILKITLMLFAGKPENYIVTLSPFTAKKVSFDLYSFANVRDFEDMLSAIGRTDYEKIYRNVLSDGKLSYLKFENAFEEYFDEYLEKLIKKCFRGGERTEIINIIRKQRDERLILRRFRICRYYPSMINSDKRPGKDYVFTALSKKQLDDIYSAENEAELLKAVDRTKYKISGGDIENTMYREMFKYIRKEFRFSSNPGVVTYCYLFLADNEARNIRVIAEGIKYGLPPEEIKSQLCY